MRNLIISLALICFAIGCSSTSHVANPRCEYLSNPLAIDSPHPRLSWEMQTSKQNERQMAYQILVASSRELLTPEKADLWNTQKIESDRTTQIEYHGKPIPATTQVFWKVRIWNAEDQPSAWSEINDWEKGLEHWQAKWIGSGTGDASPAPMFRKTFAVHGKVAKARLYICGLGYHEVRLNGEKVGDHERDPALTNYDKRVLYVTHDVTKQLQQGENAIGVILGTGWYDPHQPNEWHWEQAPWRGLPKLIAELHVEFADGHQQNILSDESWKWTNSPITWNAIYGGENYDARLEKKSWDRANFDDSNWKQAKAMEAPKGKLMPQQMPPIRTVERIAAISQKEIRAGEWIFDLGQNIAGVPELTVTGCAAGTKISMQCGERLGPDGGLHQGEIDVFVKKINPGAQFQEDQYICKGAHGETWHPRFTYHGFRWIQVSGIHDGTRIKITGLVQHTDIPSVGTFECSNDLLNKIQNATRWSYVNNLMSIPTDCPTREKNGWTGDAHLAFETASYNFFGPAFYTKWCNDIDDAQHANGELPGIIPSPGWGYTDWIGTAWDSVCILVPWQMYQYYGDRRILAAHYPTMQKYHQFLRSTAKDYTITTGLGDWAPWKSEVPNAETGTACFYQDTRLLAEIAQILDKDEDAKKYADLAEKIKQSFNAKFFNPKTNTYTNGCQTALGCPLYQGLVPTEHQDAVLNKLVADIQRQNDHLDFGILGAKYVMNTLSQHGRSDVAYAMLAQKDQPSWGWWIENGATTLYESWKDVDSRNHIMFGDVSAWMFKNLAGIQRGSPSFSKIIIRPQIVGDLTWARASYHCIHGEIKSSWKRDGNKIELNVTIPSNTTALVYVPGETDPRPIRSGTYHFTSTLR